MEISADEALALLKDPRNLLNKPEYVKLNNGGRSLGARGISDGMRKIIGAAAHHDTLASVAETFGVSPTTVAMAKKGNVGVNRHDPELAEAITEKVEASEKAVREAALTRLAEMFASSISPEALGTLKPREAVSAARDLSTVVEKMTPKADGAKTAVFIHIARERSEDEYDAVEVRTKEVKQDLG